MYTNILVYLGHVGRLAQWFSTFSDSQIGKTTGFRDGQYPVRSKVKIKLSLRLTKHHAMKTIRANRSIAPRFHNLGTR
jgi:hypothetical protein